MARFPEREADIKALVQNIIKQAHSRALRWN
jgi:hypothetical protein